MSPGGPGCRFWCVVAAAVGYHGGAMYDITAFILAGGQSSRMGTEKAFLELDGHLLIDRMIGIAKSVSEAMRIVGPKQKFGAFGQIVTDVYAERGPLGGIHAALAISPTEYNLMLAIDMPFLDKRFLQYMLAEAHKTPALVVVPKVGGGYQPLCAVYRKAFAEVADKALSRGDNKIDTLFEPGITRVIDEAEFGQLGLPPTMFQNLNTREEYEKAKSSGAR